MTYSEKQNLKRWRDTDNRYPAETDERGKRESSLTNLRVNILIIGLLMSLFRRTIISTISLDNNFNQIKERMISKETVTKSYKIIL